MKRFMILAMVLVMSLFITGFRAAAAETEDIYTIVKDGVNNDIKSMGESEDYTVLSVKSFECVSEKTYTTEVKFFSNGEEYRLWIYLDKYQDEAIAILYCGDEIDDQSHMSLTEAADDYR